MKEEEIKNVLDKYYELQSKIAYMKTEDALDELQTVAEEMVDILTDIQYCE